MAKRIAICNQKGGVGKSTSAVNVGAYLALSGKKTLLFDLDPQGNATTACGIERNALENDTYSVLLEGTNISQAIVNTIVSGFSIVPASMDLAGAELQLAQQPQRESVLKRICDPVTDSYDYILFDCPPALGLITINALVAADSTMIPVQCEYLALEGLKSLMHSIALVKQRLNPGLRIGGILLTMTDFRMNLSREVAEDVRRFFKDMVFDTSIPRNIRLAESPSFGKPICLYDPQSTGALAYQLLTQEMLSKERSAVL